MQTNPIFQNPMLLVFYVLIVCGYPQIGISRHAFPPLCNENLKMAKLYTLCAKQTASCEHSSAVKTNLCFDLNIAFWIYKYPKLLLATIG